MKFIFNIRRNFIIDIIFYIILIFSIISFKIVSRIFFNSFNITIFIFYNFKRMTNAVNRVNVKVRTSLGNPFIRQHNSTTINIIKKTNNFNNRNRLFSFSRNTISKLNIKTFFLYHFKSFWSIRNKIAPTRNHNFSISFLFNFIFIFIFIR